MDDKDINKIAKDVAGDLDFSDLFIEDNEGEDQVNFWIPKSYKAKYQVLQAESKKKLGKLIKDAIMICIDRAESQKHAS